MVEQGQNEGPYTIFRSFYKKTFEVMDFELVHLRDMVVLHFLRGSYQRLHEATGWEPEIPISQTLTDLLEDWRARIAAAV